MRRDDFAQEFARRIRFALQKHERERIARRRLELLTAGSPTRRPADPTTLGRAQEQLEHDGQLFTHALEDLGRLLEELVTPGGISQ